MRYHYNFYNRKAELVKLKKEFKDKVIDKKECLSIIMLGENGAGKTRLVEELLNEIIEDKGIISEIPKFKIENNVLRYNIESENPESYEPFKKIKELINIYDKVVEISIKTGQFALALVGVNDAVNAFSDLFKTVKSDDNVAKKKNKKDVKLFNDYRRTIKRVNKKNPLIIYFENAQNLDSNSKELLRKITSLSGKFWGCVILEVNESRLDDHKIKFFKELENDFQFQRLNILALDKEFPKELLNERFGNHFIDEKANDILYARSEGYPGKLIDFIENICIKEGWITRHNNTWIKAEEFNEKIKPPNQKLIELVISLLEDNQLDPSEINTIKRMAKMWNVEDEKVTKIVNSISAIVESGYNVRKRIGYGLVGEDAYQAEKENERYIVEVVSHDSYDEGDLAQEAIINFRDKRIVSSLEIIELKHRLLIVWDYFEEIQNRKIANHHFYEQVLQSIDKHLEILEGLNELYNNNQFHGFLSPEAIIDNPNNNSYKLLTLNSGLVKKIKFEQYPERVKYLSPEHFQDKSLLDIRSDLYSVGVMLYKSIYFRFPFESSNPENILTNMQKQDISFESEIKAESHIILQPVIEKALKFKLSERYQYPGEFYDKLFETRKEIENYIPPDLPLPPSPTKKSLPVIKKLLPIAGILIIGFGFFYLFSYFIPLDKKRTEIKNSYYSISVSAKEAELSSEDKIFPEQLENLLYSELSRIKNVKTLTDNSFKKLFPDTENAKYLPGHTVEIELLKRSFNYELRLDVINNKRNERRDTVINFNDPTEILGNKLEASLSFIYPFIRNSDKLNFNYYTNQWDAFSAYFQGEKYWDKLDVTHSVMKYNEAKSIDPSYLLPYLKLAKVQRFNGKIIEAKKNINKVIDNINVLYTVDSLKALAIYHLLEGRIRKGIRYQREVKKYEPLNIETYYDIAEAYFEIRDISKAKEHYEKCLEIDNSFTPALNHYAYCLSHKGNHQKALEFFNKYVYFDSSANSFDSQGDGYFAAGLLDSAIMAKKKGLERNPELDYIYNNLGFIYLRKGKINTAIDHFKINIDLNSESPENINEGLSNIAFGLYQIGKFNSSIDTLLKAKSIYEKDDLMTQNHKLDWVLAMNYLAIEEYNKAEKIVSEMKDMIEKYQLSPSNYHELLKYYYHLRFFFNVKEGDEEKMKEVLNLFEYQIRNKVKDWSSPFDLAFFQTELGRILFENDYYDLADQQFKRALEYNQKYPFAHYYLSKILADDEEQTNENHEIFMNVWENADESFLQHYNIE